MGAPETVLSPWMLRAIAHLGKFREGATATTVGAFLTGRRSSFGPQTSAREGGRTLRALERRGLARVAYDDFHEKWMWKLTAKGVERLSPPPREEASSR